MAITTYSQWVADGSPWRPAAYIGTFAATLRGHGFVVGTIGAVSTHLNIDFPEDHAPYSHTPWPGPQPYPNECACDIMPGGAVDLATLGAQIVADKMANVAGTEWIKYINWTDASGNCWHDSWKPNHDRLPSTDKEHIHLSGRTDYVDQPTSYDPVARLLHPTSARTLQIGDTGLDVRALQHQLGLKEDGIFGPVTQAAVKRFQAAHGLVVDGIVGPRTRAALPAR